MDLESSKVKLAADAILKYIKQKQESELELLDEQVPVQLQFGFHKVPNVKDKNIKVRLPNTLVTSTSSVCLFAKDLKKRGSDVEESKSHWEDMLKDNKINNIEAIPLKQLKTEYIPYEAKKNLSNMYDVYLADERIMHLLPSFLGKHFYGRKRVPVPINMEDKDLKKEVERVLSISQCEISGKGPSCQMQVGHAEFKAKALVENIVASVQKVVENVPGGKENLKSIHVKSTNSPAILVYWSQDSPNDVTLTEVKDETVLDKAEEVTTVLKGKVRVLKDGTVQLINRRTKKLYNEKGQLKESVKKRYAKQKRNMSVERNLRKKSFKNKGTKKAEEEEVEVDKQEVKKEEAVKSKRKSEDLDEVEVSSPPTKKTKVIAESGESSPSKSAKKGKKVKTTKDTEELVSGGNKKVMGDDDISDHVNVSPPAKRVRTERNQKSELKNNTQKVEKDVGAKKGKKNKDGLKTVAKSNVTEAANKQGSKEDGVKKGKGNKNIVNEGKNKNMKKAKKV